MAEEEIHIHDILIIGAGPSGLALAARLRESTPSALFTDSEHQRYHWMRSSSTSRRTSKPVKVSRRSCTATDRLLSGPSSPQLDIAVLDAHSNSWMSAWDKKFKDLDISHLRSPMFFHPDPRDRDGLLSFAYRGGTPPEGELREIKGVVGKELSKHQRKQKIKTGGKRRQETNYLDERERHDYFRPSQSLFKSYCEDIIARYNLSDLVQKTEVASICFDSSDEVFTLQTSTDSKRARIVVLATGSSVKPSIPPHSPFTKYPEGSVCHAFSPISVIPPNVEHKIRTKKTTTMVVVGGGLTSAQISALAISSGVSKVYHLTRGPLKTKHFDVDLNWVGKYKNFHLAAFWSAKSDEERWEMIRDARGGGSINPEYKCILYGLVKQGKVVLCEHTNVTGAAWDQVRQSWTVETEPRIENLPSIDHVVYATGVPADINSVSMLQPLIREREIEVVGGMPCLTDDLMWDARTPFFVTGRLAGLRLGPGAGNLEGARQGAERIAWKVGELLQGNVNGADRKDDIDMADSGYGSMSGLDEEDGEVDMGRLGLGHGNQFSILGISDEE